MLMLLYIKYGRRRSGLSSAPLDMEYDNNSIEESTNSHSSKHVNMNIDIDIRQSLRTLRCIVSSLLFGDKPSASLCSLYSCSGFSHWLTPVALL